jgi:hypothetical protein
MGSGRMRHSPRHRLINLDNHQITTETPGRKTMTRSTIKTTMATLLAATIATAALSSAASAGGSISFNIAPKNAQEEQAIKAGLAIYGIVNAVQGGAINQNGTNNMAGLAQLGSGNFGVVHQEGDGHNGTLQQNGNGNSYGIFQFGEGTSNDVVQNGNGETGATFSFGW